MVLLNRSDSNNSRRSHTHSLNHDNTADGPSYDRRSNRVNASTKYCSVACEHSQATMVRDYRLTSSIHSSFVCHFADSVGWWAANQPDRNMVRCLSFGLDPIGFESGSVTRMTVADLWRLQLILLAAFEPAYVAGHVPLLASLWPVRVLVACVPILCLVLPWQRGDLVLRWLSFCSPAVEGVLLIPKPDEK